MRKPGKKYHRRIIKLSQKRKKYLLMWYKIIKNIGGGKIEKNAFVM